LQLKVKSDGAVPSSRALLMQNSVWMMAGQAFAVVAQAMYFLAVARLLGNAEYGVFVGAAAAVSIVSQYGSFGSGLLFLRYVSPDRTLFAKYWGNVLFSVTVFGTVLVAGLAALAPWLLKGRDARLILLLAVGDCVCGQLVTSIGQVFQAFEKMRYTALVNLAVNAARMYTAGAMLLILHHAGAISWAIASLAISITTAVAGVVFVTRHFGRPEFELRLFFRRAGEGFVFAVSGSTTSIYNDVDKAMLAHLGMNAANGIYTMAYRVIDIGAVPLRSIHAAAFPRFFRHGARNAGLAGTVPLAKKLLLRTSLLGLGMAVVMFLAAPVIPTFVGKGFQESVSALRWLCLLPFFRAFHLSAGDALAGAGKQKVRLAFQVIAAGANIVMNIVLIPRYSWRGAAWSSLMTDGMLGVMLWCIILNYNRKAAQPGVLTLLTPLEEIVGT
jgi:O-antigen/teichoic acid export membrane protein